MRFPARSVASIAILALLFFVQCALACDLTPPHVPHCPKHAPESGHHSQKLCKDVAAVFDQAVLDIAPQWADSPVLFTVDTATVIATPPPAVFTPPPLTALRI
ncbi:MAG: hypothetical protein NTZ56_14700 [Acidobacteria bacterium]|nr:hypothetical protein [Acidobacteriota bacterium]